MSEPKDRLAKVTLTVHPKRKKGDKGQWKWSIKGGNGEPISAQTELLCNKAEAINAMRISRDALSRWLVDFDKTPAEDDGESPTDALSTPAP
mgnify:CR=1 FL=1